MMNGELSLKASFGRRRLVRMNRNCCKAKNHYNQLKADDVYDSAGYFN